MPRLVRVKERTPLDREHGIVLRRKGDGWYWTRWTLAGTRIRPGVLWGFVAAGDSVEFIARSYGLHPEQVQAAVDWVEQRRDRARKGWATRRAPFDKLRSEEASDG